MSGDPGGASSRRDGLYDTSVDDLISTLLKWNPALGSGEDFYAGRGGYEASRFCARSTSYVPHGTEPASMIGPKAPDIGMLFLRTVAAYRTLDDLFGYEAPTGTGLEGGSRYISDRTGEASRNKHR